MRKYLLILTLFAALGCEEPESDQGCLTGIPKNGGTDRVLIRCCTREQYLAGSNTSAGGISYWDSYTDHEWGKCDDCK